MKGVYYGTITENRYENLAVVFLTHVLQFPRSDWKEIRSKLKKCKGERRKKSIYYKELDAFYYSA